MRLGVTSRAAVNCRSRREEAHFLRLSVDVTSAPTIAERSLRRRLAFIWAAAACLILLLGLSANAEIWTNRAGHVITAQLVAVEGGQVILQHTNGRTWRLPLSSLKPADQQRAREQTEMEQLPSELRACLTQAQEDIQRAALFLEGAKITRDEYAARCEKIKQRFEYLGLQALKARGEESNTGILGRLKRRLDQAEQAFPATLPPPRKPDNGG